MVTGLMLRASAMTYKTMRVSYDNYRLFFLNIPSRKTIFCFGRRGGFYLDAGRNKEFGSLLPNRLSFAHSELISIRYFSFFSVNHFITLFPKILNRGFPFPDILYFDSLVLLQQIQRIRIFPHPG